MMPLGTGEDLNAFHFVAIFGFLLFSSMGRFLIGSLHSRGQMQHELPKSGSKRLMDPG